jgi:hypothetical protein
LAALTDGEISASRLANHESGLRRSGIEEAEALAKAPVGVSVACSRKTARIRPAMTGSAGFVPSWKAHST